MEIPIALEFVEEVGNQLIFSGKKYRFVAPPYSGKSWVLDRIAHYVETVGGPECVVRANGREWTEQNQSDMLDELLDRSTRAHSEGGFAVVVFDHYGHALKLSKSNQTQSRLYSFLISSAHAQSIGFLGAHRVSEMVNLNIKASPFIGLVEALPLWRAGALNDGHDTASRISGRLPGHLANAYDFFSQEPSISKWHAFEAGAIEKLITDLPEDIFGRSSVQQSVALQRFIEVLSGDRSGELPSGWHEVVLRGSDIHGNWPTTFQDSVLRFAFRLNQLGASYWYDRYLCSPQVISRVLGFLSKVRRRSSSSLRILVGYKPEWDNWGDILALACNLKSDFDIEMRVSSDRHYIHDRHLKSVVDSSAYMLPQASEILCAAGVGSSTDGKAILNFDYGRVWQTATRLVHT